MAFTINIGTATRGISYTKEQTNSLLADKTDKINTYTKTEVNFV